MVLPGKRVIRGESLQPILSCARNCATPARLSSAQHNSEYSIDLIVRSSTLDFSRRLGQSWRNHVPEKIDPTLRRKLGLLRSEAHRRIPSNAYLSELVRSVGSDLQ